MLRPITRTCSLLSLLVAGIFLTIALATTRPSAAQEPAATPTATESPPATGCDELNVIFVVDQSGSMGGFTTPDGQAVPPTDPGGLRFQGPESALNTLASLREGLYESTTMKMAMIYFGSDVRTAMPWQDITPANKTEKDALLARLAPFFAPIPSMNQTLPYRGLQAASSLFTQVREPVDGCPIRAVIIITDGRPADGTTTFSPAQHYQQMADYVQTYLAPPDHRVYVIGIDISGTYFDANRDEWAAIAGDDSRVFEVANAREMGGSLNQIITPLTRELEPDGAPPIFYCVEDGVVNVPPYVREMRVQIVKGTVDDHLILTDAEGTLIAPSTPNATFEGREDLIEIATITNPVPGVWSIGNVIPPELVGSCLATFTAFIAEERVVEPAGPNTNVVQYSRVPIEFQILGAGGAALPDYSDPQYNLTMDVKLTTPDGVEEVLTLGANPGRAYRGEILARHPGVNQLTVRPISRNPDRSIFYLFGEENDGVKSISTITVEPVQLNVLQPPPIVARQYHDITGTFAVGTADQLTTTIDLTVRPQATLVRDGGAPVPVNITTRPDGVYVASARIEEAGSYVLSYTAAIDVPGGTDTLGPLESRFDVLPTRLLSARFDSPESMVATDIFGPLGSNTGIDLTVQLVNESGSPIGISEAGLFDPNRVFKLTIRDSDGADVTGGLALVQADGPGRYRLPPNQLGVGNYNVTVEPVGEPAEGFAWQSANWTYGVTGVLNPYFYGVVGAAALALALLVLLGVRIVAVTRHPLQGRLLIYEEMPLASGGVEPRKLVDRSLAGRMNRITFRPRIGAGKGKRISSVRVWNTPELAKQGAVRVRIKRQKGQPFERVLSPGQPQQIETGLYVVKDRLPDPASYGGSTRVLQDP